MGQMQEDGIIDDIELITKILNHREMATRLSYLLGMPKISVSDEEEDDLEDDYSMVQDSLIDTFTFPEYVIDQEKQDKFLWELEERIMTDLYGWTHPESGHRVVYVALRNKDAVMLGYGGPDCGDIVYWMAEGYNMDHCDSLPTADGYADTSVGPIFIAAGKGIKEGIETERWIRQVDVVPTVAFMAGVRVPDQCEGAPIYQIMEQY